MPKLFTIDAAQHRLGQSKMAMSCHFIWLTTRRMGFRPIAGNEKLFCLREERCRRRRRKRPRPWWSGGGSERQKTAAWTDGRQEGRTGGGTERAML